MAAEVAGTLPIGGSSMFAFGSPPRSGYQNPFNGGGGSGAGGGVATAFSTPHDDGAPGKKVSPLSPQLRKTADEQIGKKVLPLKL